MDVAGYQITRSPSLAHDIASGKYRWLQEMKIATVLDIGANQGQFAEMIRQVLPHAMIYSFEPLESCFKELTAKARSLMPIQCFSFALGEKETQMMIHHNDFSASSSLLPMGRRHREAFPFTQHAVEERVTVRSLDCVVPELELKPKILVKLDVQGYELNVLAGAEKTLPLIDVLIVETSFVELYEGQPLFKDVHNFLTERGFAHFGNLDQISDPSNGFVLQADSIFVNTKTEEGREVPTEIKCN